MKAYFFSSSVTPCPPTPCLSLVIPSGHPLTWLVTGAPTCKHSHFAIRLGDLGLHDKAIEKAQGQRKKKMRVTFNRQQVSAQLIPAMYFFVVVPPLTLH